jgi:Cys-rich protein (TIGR01571 family)
MVVKGEEHEEDAGITVDTLPPQPVEPPQAALAYATLNTDQVATPIDMIQTDADIVAASSPVATLTTSQRLCTVISPSTLPEGYTFPAQVDGIDFVVTVPVGGVVEGQAFTVLYPAAGALQPLSIDLVTPNPVMMSSEEEVKGGWRNDLCACFEVCENGMCLQGFFCTPILLAQIMTRFLLNPLGVYGPLRYRRTFWWILSFWIAYLVTSAFLWNGGIMAFLADVVFLSYFVVVSTNVRSGMRRRYDIRPECCAGCDGVLDDCCCIFWCCPCSTIQMARHTHNTDTYPYHCCTKTGLSLDAPALVV